MVNQISSTLMKIDAHLHTNYSRDCTTSLEVFRKVCLKKGITPCITDHNTVEGAFAYRKKYGKGSCIVGEEIRTRQGEVIGLFVEEQIPAHLDIHETLDILKAQDAIVIIPHPFDRLRTSRLHEDILKLSRKHRIDCIEIFNSRTVFDEDNRKACSFADSHKDKFLRIVGSDAHTPYEIGKSYVEMKDVDITDKKGFLSALKNSQYEKNFITRKSSIMVHAVTKVVKIFK